MIKLIASLFIFVTAQSAFAGLYGYAWHTDTAGQYKCFQLNAEGQIPKDSVSVGNDACLQSYAWGKFGATVACYPVGVGGAYLPSSKAVDNSHCQLAYVWAHAASGKIDCFSTGADGEILAGALSVDDKFCSNAVSE